MDNIIGEIVLKNTNKIYHNESVTVQDHAITSMDVVDYIFNYKDIYNKYGFIMYCKRSATNGEHRRFIKVLKSAAMFICTDNNALYNMYIFSLYNKFNVHIDILYITKENINDDEDETVFIRNMYYKCKMLFGNDIDPSYYIDDGFFMINCNEIITEGYYIS